MNEVIMVGRVATDIELRQTQSGKSVATYKIAVNRKYKNADGKREADFFPVVVWGQQAEFVHQYGAKGREICVGGQLQNRSYKAQDGSMRYVTEIIAIDVQLIGARPDAQQQEKPGAFVETDEPLPF